MAVFGTKTKVQELETENASLKQWVDYLKGTEAVALAAQVRAARGEVAQVQQQVALAHAELASVRAEAVTERALIVETRELAMLQEVGIYDYRHPVESALGYKQRLDQTKTRIKQMVASDRAVNAATGWTVNSSLAQGERMVRDMKKLMLRAYNAEADNAVRTLKPHTLNRSIERLAKSRETIARLGKIMSIRVSDEYHRLRVYELELTADYLSKVEEEKERVRAERERQREEEKARRDFENAKAKLRKEQAHYETAYAKALAAGDAAGAETLKVKLGEIGAAIVDVEARAANTRAGYVYVISNVGAFGERMIKIGMTRRLEPTDRIRELGDASVPFRFDTHALIFSEDAVGLESRLHLELTDRRVNRVNAHREFFYATASEVRDLLARIGSPDLLLEYTDIAQALEWRASGAYVIETPPRAGDDEVVDPLESSEEPLTVGNAESVVDDADDLLGELELPDEDPVAPSEVSPAPRHSRPDGDGSEPSPDPTVPAATQYGSRDDANVEAHDPPANAGVSPSLSAAPELSSTSPPAPLAADSAGTATAPPPATPAQASPGGAGWHPDPWRQARLRWWDGARWTSHVTQ